MRYSTQRFGAAGMSSLFASRTRPAIAMSQAPSDALSASERPYAGATGTTTSALGRVRRHLQRRVEGGRVEHLVDRGPLALDDDQPAPGAARALVGAHELADATGVEEAHLAQVD